MNPQLNTPTPKRQLTDEEVQSLLAINSLQVSDNQKGSKSFLIFLISVTVIVIALSLFLGYRNGQKTKTTPTGSSTSSSNPFNSSSTVNQQVKYCSNVINAQTSC